MLYIGGRLSFHKSRLIAEQAGKGDSYSVIKVICICITACTLFPEAPGYFDMFRFYI
jgi:hypothetical protein